MSTREAQQAARIRELIEEVEGLQGRIAVYEQALQEAVPEALLPGLTPTEAIIVGQLVKRRICSRELLFSLVQMSRGGDREGLRVIDSHIKRIRRKLTSLGSRYVIESEYGFGYRLTEVPPA